MEMIMHGHYIKIQERIRMRQEGALKRCSNCSNAKLCIFTRRCMGWEA
jgi:hypothetical protein